MSIFFVRNIFMQQRGADVAEYSTVSKKEIGHRHGIVKRGRRNLGSNANEEQFGVFATKF